MNIILLEESEKRPSLNGETYFLVKSEVKLDEIEDFLDSATNEQTVFFHDQFYPTHPDDDPGAYVEIRRSEFNPSEYQYMYGNHHWSSNWSHQSLKFLSAYILINANSERFDEEPFTLKIYKTFRAKKPTIPQDEKKIEKETFISKFLDFFKK
jgi:hypothetical protein